MLVLTRKANQAIAIGRDVRVVVLSIERDQVRLGIEAPRSTSVLREELVEGDGAASPDGTPADAG